MEAQTPAETDTAEPLIEEGPDGTLLIRGSVSRIASYVAMMALSVGSTVVVTQHLHTVNFGRFTTATSVGSMVALVTDAGMANLGVRQYALLSGAERTRAMATLLGLRMALTTVGVGLAVLFALVAGYDGEMTLGVLAVSAGTLPVVLVHTYSIPLTNDLRITAVALLDLARQVVWVVGLIAVAVLGGGVLALLVVTPVAYLLIVPLAAVVCRGMISLSARFSMADWKALAAPTAVFSLAAAVATVYVYVVQLTTDLVTDGYQTGLFSVSFRVVVTAATMPALIGSAAIPVLTRAAKDDHGRVSYITARFMEVSVGAGLGVALVMAAASGFVVSVVAPGRGFHAAGAVLAIQAFAMIGTFASSPSNFALLSLGRYRTLLVGNVLALAVTLAVTIVLAHSYGAKGAAVSTIVGETLTALALLVGLAWQRPEVLPRPLTIAKLLLAAGLTAPVAFLLPIPSIARAALAATVYGVLVLLLRALPSEILDGLPRWLRW